MCDCVCMPVFWPALIILHCPHPSTPLDCLHLTFSPSLTGLYILPHGLCKLLFKCTFKMKRNAHTLHNPWSCCQAKLFSAALLKLDSVLDIWNTERNSNKVWKWHLFCCLCLCCAAAPVLGSVNSAGIYWLLYWDDRSQCTWVSTTTTTMGSSQKMSAPMLLCNCAFLSLLRIGMWPLKIRVHVKSLKRLTGKDIHNMNWWEHLCVDSELQAYKHMEQ